MSGSKADICSATAHVRFGSEADICSAKRNVRFTPESDIDCVFQHVCLGPKADIGRRVGAFARLIAMPQYENPDRARAERLFKTGEQKAAPKATADYYAAEQAVRDRTQELRRLRLARDGHRKRDLAS